MVQVIQGYPSRSSAIGQILGESLGEGLGNFMGMYQANKSLEKVLNDPSMKDAPIEQRLTALQKALSPHGKRGQSILKQRLEMEEVIGKEKERATEAAQKLQAQTVAASDQQLLAKEASGIKLTQEELAKLSPKSLTDVMKARNKAPAGGTTSQPTPPDIQSKIGSILGASKGMDADQLALAMDEAGIPRIFSNSYIDTRRKTSEQDIKNIMEFHKESQKYDEELMDNARATKKQLVAVQDIKKALKSGNVKPTSWANTFKAFGHLGEQFSDAVANKDQTTIQTLAPQLLEGWKDVFGVRLSDADLKILKGILPSIGKSVEANEEIVRLLEKYGQMTLAREKISREIKQENKGLRPLGYADMIEQRFDEMMERGVSGRTKVIPGTRLPEQGPVIDFYLKLSNGDPDEALRMALEDGYEY